MVHTRRIRLPRSTGGTDPQFTFRLSTWLLYRSRPLGLHPVAE